MKMGQRDIKRCPDCNGHLVIITPIYDHNSH